MVNVPAVEPVIESKTINANGTYTPSAGVDGFAPVVVNVPVPTLTTLEATANGTYNAPSGTAYDEVLVNVQAPAILKMSNCFNTWIQNSMIVTWNGSTFTVAWDNGNQIGAQLYSNFDVSNYSSVRISGYCTNVHYYNGTQPDNYKLTLGFSSTKPLDYSGITDIGTPTYFTGDNEILTVEMQVPNQTCYLYFSCGGYNFQNVTLELIP